MQEPEHEPQDVVDLVQALTSFETFEILAATRRPERVAQLISHTARSLLAVDQTTRG
jgi:hypothetical protein